jgi:hypothetical protein
MIKRRYLLLAFALTLNSIVWAQPQNHYVASSVTGQLTLVRTVNPKLAGSSPQGALVAGFGGPETSKLPSKFPHPPLSRPPLGASAFQTPLMHSLLVTGSSAFGFDGMTHFDQREVDNGNDQFSVEPPNPSIAVANGFIVEGVNNAFRVYTTSGTPLLPTLSSNQLFGLPPAINRITGINGPFPTDMRVFFDQDINRWFVLQRSQDNDSSGNPLDSSHIYMAVSQTADPTGIYNIYVMDTTNVSNPGCPCLPDFPQIGSDHYGFYISANEYNTSALQFVDVSLLAISKAALGSSALAPPTYRFIVTSATGFEFAIQPATTPPGASFFIGQGGVEYFASTQSASSTDSDLAIWALSNSASLQNTSGASLLLTQTSVPILTYSYPSVATQRPGPLPYGSSLSPPGALAFIDGGPDSRVLSLTYAGANLFVTFATQVRDENGSSLVGGAYVVLSPTFRNGVIGAPVLTEGYLVASNNHILRPAVSVNAKGHGAIGFTLVGPDYFPSAAFVAFDTVTAPSVIQLAASGAFPEDGFTGYPGGSFPGVARWGDYATAVTGNDGNIWIVNEYIPNAPRTTFANWGTFISKYLP